MKSRYIFGSAIIAIFLVVAFFQISKNETSVKGLDYAIETGQTVQVIGYWDKEQSTNYNSSNNQFTFFMSDSTGARSKVILDGAKPPNFELAEKIFVKGSHNGDFFHATEVMTKCPSKYEGKGEHPDGVVIEDNKINS